MSPSSRRPRWPQADRAHDRRGTPGPCSWSGPAGRWPGTCSACCGGTYGRRVVVMWARATTAATGRARRVLRDWGVRTSSAFELADG